MSTPETYFLLYTAGLTSGFGYFLIMRVVKKSTQVIIDTL